MKILHVPTDEAKIFATIDAPAAAPLENVALCLAVFFAAAVAVDHADIQSTLGQPRDISLYSFKVGLEQALAQGRFLDRPTLTGLQALTIYLVSVPFPQSCGSFFGSLRCPRV